MSFFVPVSGTKYELFPAESIMTYAGTPVIVEQKALLVPLIDSPVIDSQMEYVDNYVNKPFSKHTFMLIVTLVALILGALMIKDVTRNK